MHILTVVESPSWIEHHVLGSLSDMGHQVHRFAHGAAVGDYYGRARRAERRKKNQELLDIASELSRQGSLDLIFCYVYDDFLTVDTAKAMARLGVPMVNFNVDMVNQWYRQIRTARFFTYILCAQKANMANLSGHKARVLYFPMAARVKREGNEVSFAPDAPVTFLGTPMPYRTRVLAELHRAGVPLAVYGRLWKEGQQALPERSFEKTLSDIAYYGWPRLKGEGFGSLIEALKNRAMVSADGVKSALSDTVKHGALSDAAIVSLFNKSAINLGFTRMAGADPTIPGRNQVKLRDFEIPLAGGFYLVEKAPEYEEFFVLGKEVDTWRTPGELLEKIRYYLDHPAQSKAIAQAGQRRALAEHTWQHRFEMLFSLLNLK